MGSKPEHIQIKSKDKQEIYPYSYLSQPSGSCYLTWTPLLFMPCATYWTGDIYAGLW